MKKRVHNEIWKDMKKYVKGLNPNEYEVCWEETDPNVIKFLRAYYDEHLPVDVNAWARANAPDEFLIYPSAIREQVGFVRNKLCRLLYSTDKEWENNLPMVISTHYSESVKLPVYQINLEKYGIEMVLRYNFYDWKISIKSDKPLDFDCMGIFNLTEEISSVYCEGFPKNKIYGSYENNHSQFTIEIRTNYDLYTFVFLLKNYLGIEKER